MAQIRKVEFVVEIQSSADKFYEVFRSKVFLLPTICPQHFKQGKLIQGDGKSVGSVRAWHFVAADHDETTKDVVEAIDDESKTITSNQLEGDVLKIYKSFKTIMIVTGTGKGSLVKWTIEFEKENETIPDPIQYKTFLTDISNSIDAYLISC